LNIDERICALRKQNNYSQEDFAELLHVSRQTVSNWENGKSYPDLGTILKISQIFQISIDEWLRGDSAVVKKMDSQKKKKNILYIVSGILLLVTTIAIVSAYWLYQGSRMSFDMSDRKTYQVASSSQTELEVGNGFFALAKDGKVDVTAAGDVDDGHLRVSIASSDNGKTVYQKSGDTLKDEQTIYLKKGVYKIQITANDFKEKIVSLSYDINVDNK
jgi:transcriptional regulator with XRE-family HTH domain